MKDKTTFETSIVTNGNGVSNGTKARHHSDNTNHRRRVKENNINELTNAAPIEAVVPDEEEVPTRLQIIQDKANLCTFSGAVLAMLAMACMWRGKYFLGMFLNTAANVADIIDGPIARSTPNRRPVFSVVGCKLDCYSDLVSHFVVPASLLMHLTDLNPICTTLAVLHVCTGILRQSYFEVTGRCANGTCIYGMTSDYMVVIYSITMHLLPIAGMNLMPYFLSFSVVFMIYASLTFSLRSRRYEGFGLFTVTAYNVFLSFSSFLLLLVQDGDQSFFVASVLLFVNLVLCYPCYFRFVELNV